MARPIQTPAKRRMAAAKKRAREIIYAHRLRHNVMAGSYWPELARTFTAAMVELAARRGVYK